MNKNYIGAGMIAISIILFWAFVLPLYNRVSDLDVAIKEREGLIQSRSTIIANIKSLDQEYQKRIQEITKLSAIIPSKKSIAEVLSSLDDISLKNGIGLINSSIIGQKLSSTNTDSYNILPVELILNGSYLSLTNFLKALESNLRLIDITGVDASIQNENSANLNLSVKGRAYYLK